MSREVRHVAADWEHPKAPQGWKHEVGYIPMHDGRDHGGYARSAAEWDQAWQKWQEGMRRGWGDEPRWTPIEAKYRLYRYTDYSGERPSPDLYMPDWSDEERTHLMMYETTSEGTPISPAFKTAEELARWLADNNASAFAGEGASYEDWMATINNGWALSAYSDGSGLRSGVEFEGKRAAQ